MFDDFNGDGDITGKDIDAFCLAYNNLSSRSELADGNCDGLVDDADTASMEANYGSTMAGPWNSEWRIQNSEWGRDRVCWMR